MRISLVFTICTLTTALASALNIFSPTPVWLRRPIPITDSMANWVVDELQGRRGLTLACYQPGFIAAQILNACQFEGRSPEVTEELILEALSNLYAGSKTIRIDLKILVLTVPAVLSRNGSY